MNAKVQIEIPRERIEEFCRKWKITELSLFGPVLRDDFRPHHQLSFTKNRRDTGATIARPERARDILRTYQAFSYREQPPGAPRSLPGAARRRPEAGHRQLIAAEKR